MLRYKGLNLNFQAEEINYANYIVNHTPTKVLRNITLEETWSSIKPDVSHFRVFGSEAWDHILDGKHKDLEPKSEKCIFVGYSEDVKGYRLLQPKYKNVIIRRDVTFDEIHQTMSLFQWVCHLWPASLIRHMCFSLSLLFLKTFLLVQMMTARMTILLHLLKILLQLHSFPNESALLEMHQVLLQVTLQINVVHVLSSTKPLPYWLKFQKILIQTPLKKLQVIQIGMQL